jgi:hypothetical protein
MPSPTAPTNASRAPWWRRVTLRDVLFLTLPPFALVLWLFGASVLDYHRIRQFDDWWSNATSVRKFGWYRLRSLARAPRMATLRNRLAPEREDWPSLRLAVEGRDWKRIDSDVGAHWGEWIDVTVVEPGGLHDAELRFRGDGSAHWTSEKKSFTLKSKRGELVRGFGTLAFSAKDVLPQWLASEIARDFDLLAPEQAIVPVFLNERFHGLYRFVEPVDESFLRRNLRMPGNVFRADTAERGDYFKGTPREVFLNPYIWDRAAKNDRPGAAGTAALGEFLADLNTATFEEHERFMSWLDEGELSRLLAYLLVVGDPYHMSGVHNQYWYEDPTSGTLHPVLWDVRLLDLEAPPRDSNVNRFWRAALRDPRVWNGALREVAARLKDDRLLREAEQRARGAWERYRDAFEYDSLRAGIVLPVGDPDTAVAMLKKNLDTLRSWIADARASVGIESGRVGVIDVSLGGRAPCRVERIAVRLPESGSRAPIDVIADSDASGAIDGGDERLARVEPRAENETVTIELGLELPASCRAAGDALVADAISYRLFVASAAEGFAVVSCELENAITRGEVDVGAWPKGAAIAEATAWHPWRRASPPPRERVIDAHVTYRGPAVVSFDPHETVTIRPGTQIFLDRDTSLLFEGKVLALGTAEQPITIARVDPEFPWGVVALQGAAASGSRFEHVRFLGGGGALIGRVEYKGSVCVHDATGVVFESCEFAANSRCDDLLNVVEGSADVLDCHFHDANADSIDYDMASGLIARNRIERSGNDGLDLMTCWPRVIQNVIRDSGDKGISIGEDSSPLVFGTTIERCARGIEVKDRSEPVILHSVVRECGVGVYVHLKNWRYGEAGWPKLSRSVVAGSADEGAELLYVAENAARITLHDSEMPPGRAIGIEPDNFEWALASQGIRASSDSRVNPPGAIADWGLAEPLAPTAAQAFAADFADPTRGWKRDARLRRLFQRDRDLVASFGTDRASFGTEVDWKLDDAAQRHVLVLEIAGEGVEEVEARLSSPDGDVRAPIELAEPLVSTRGGEFRLAPDSRVYRYATIDLPLRRYTELRLAAKPAAARARLYLHAWRLFALPAPGER